MLFSNNAGKLQIHRILLVMDKLSLFVYRKQYLYALKGQKTIPLRIKGTENNICTHYRDRKQYLYALKGQKTISLRIEGTENNIFMH